MAMDVSAWLTTIGLEQYVDAFRSNDIDAAILPKLTAADLKEIGVASLGHRKRLLDGIALLESGPPSEYPPSEPSEGEAAAASSIQGSDPTPERRQLTVLFADLVGSTALSQALDVEDLRDVLKSYHDAVTVTIREAGGFVAKFMGDGVLVYFGYPQATEHAAAQAVRASLEVIETVGKLPQSEKRLPLAVRIGIATGPVVVGDVIGEGIAREVNVVGETPNLAARLQGLARPNSVVVSDATARMIADDFDVKDLGLREFKGIAMPTRAFAVVQERSAAARLAATRRKEATLLVGRDAELALLLERCALSRNGHGQVVLISGDGGIGKSQLVDSFLGRVNRDDSMQIALRSSPSQQSNALLPIVSHLEQLLEPTVGDSAATRYDKLVRLVGSYRFPRANTLPLLANLLSIPLPANVSPSFLAPEQQKQHLQNDLIAWLAEEAEQKPLLIVWKDAHWIDQSSLDLLGLLIDQIPSMSIFLAVTSRPEFRPPWGSRSHFTSIALGNLSRVHIEAIVKHAARGKALPAALLDRICETADGVPLFAEELTRALLESDALRDAGDHFELAGPIQSASVPMNLNDALMARLDRLRAAKSLAQLGSVIGRTFSYDLIKTVAAYDDRRLESELGQLVSADLLSQQGMSPTTTYMFKHALVKEVAYESLLRRRREALHGAIGEAIESLEGSQAVEQQAAILAYHFARSPHRSKAIRYLLLAGDQAMRVHAVSEASSSFGEALALARGMEDTDESKRLQIDSMLKLASVGRSREDLARDQENLAQALRIAKDLEDDKALARVLYWQGRLAYVSGDLAAAIGPAEQSLAIADGLADEALAAPPTNLLGRIYTLRWDVSRGSELMARSATQMHTIGNRPEEATAVGFAALAFALHGKPEAAMKFAQRGVTLAGELADPAVEAAALFYRGTVYDQQGNWHEAIADFRAAREVAKAAGDSFRVYILNLYEGWTHLKSNDPLAGRVLIEEALRFSEQVGTVFMRALGKSWLASCAVALGDEVSLRLCHDALTEATNTSDRLARALAHRSHAEALGKQIAPARDEAGRAMNESVRLLREIEFSPELARTCASFARVLNAGGQHAMAARYYDQAMSLFKETGMLWDLEQLELQRHQEKTSSFGESIG